MTDIIKINLGGVNSYLVKTEQGFILFDTGGPLILDKQFSDRQEELQKKLDTAGCTDSKLKLIILTHGDYDHTWNAAYLKTSYNAQIAMHANDRRLVENPTMENWTEGFQYRPLAFRLAFRLLRKKIEKLTVKMLNVFTPFTPDCLLNDGFDLSIYGLDAAVIHIPGHTNGSIAVLTKDGSLISGDIYSNNKKPKPADNAVDFAQLAASVKRLKGFPIKTVYPGHGEPFNFSKI